MNKQIGPARACITSHSNGGEQREKLMWPRPILGPCTWFRKSLCLHLTTMKPDVAVLVVRGDTHSCTECDSKEYPKTSLSSLCSPLEKEHIEIVDNVTCYIHSVLWWA